MADPLVISILISVLVVFLVCTILCRYRHRICRRRGAASEGEVHVPLCTQIAMDMCCVEISNWRDLFEFQHLLLRRFLTALDFAFGMLMWEVMHETQPFGNLNAIASIMHATSNRRPVCEVPLRCSAEVAALIGRCWDSDPSVRAPMSMVAQELEEMYRSWQHEEHKV